MLKYMHMIAHIKSCLRPIEHDLKPSYHKQKCHYEEDDSGKSTGICGYLSFGIIDGEIY